jgi:glycerophosphoryl diester phosphodiesterase
MDTIKFEKKNVKMIAHRGLSGIEVENTSSAFVAAGNRSHYGIETDIYKTADGHFIVGHDDNYKRLSGEEVYLEKSTLKELQEVVFFDKDGTKNRVDLRPATLENYLSIVKKYQKHAVLELKSDFNEDEIKRLIEIIKEFDYLDKLTFISFNYNNLLSIKKFLPNQSAQYLFWKITDEEIERLVRDKIDVDIWVVELTKEQIEKCHKAGLVVNCWTVDDPKKAEELASWGIDFITSNILE